MAEKLGAIRQWTWNEIRKCWESGEEPLRIYPGDDGTFTVSTFETWHDGIFASFDAAEDEAVNGDHRRNGELTEE